MKCATHPEVETNLSCGRCGRPICPKCMVQTPVGTRCPDCAKLKRLPTFEVSSRQYLIASGVGVGVAAVAGIVWALLFGLFPTIYFYVFLAAAVGFAIGELISLSVNRKRGPILQAIAGISMVIGFATGLIFLRFSLYLLIGLALGIIVAISRLR
ncbi:MAG: hypothetical protein E3J65_03470 [Dehalococcoidia bacterium]|nr:MAG: hypothetical protein E3J65_03470 [Dehalococcoidia bacterium]